MEKMTYYKPMRKEYLIGHDSTPEQMWPRRRFKLKSKRLRKKFMKNPERYLSMKAKYELDISRFFAPTKDEEEFASRMGLPLKYLLKGPFEKEARTFVKKLGCSEEFLNSGG